MTHKAWFFAHNTSSDRTKAVREHLDNSVCRSCIARTRAQFKANMLSRWDDRYVLSNYSGVRMQLERVS